VSRDTRDFCGSQPDGSLKTRHAGQIDDRRKVARNAFYWNRGDGTYAEIAL